MGGLQVGGKSLTWPATDVIAHQEEEPGHPGSSFKLLAANLNRTLYKMPFPKATAHEMKHTERRGSA